MPNKWNEIISAIGDARTQQILLKGLGETLYMSVSATVVAIILGLPLGVLLYASRKNNFLENKIIYLPLSFLINIGRSIPYIILAISIIPLTRLITGSSIGNNAAIVPLSLAATPFVARLIEGILLEVPKGLIETAQSMGANPWQIIRKILLPEAIFGLINIFTITLITLIGYSAIAGALGAGGLGKIAYSYGHLRYNTTFIFWTILLIILLVQLIQFVGDYWAKKVNHR